MQKIWADFAQRCAAGDAVGAYPGWVVAWAGMGLWWGVVQAVLVQAPILLRSAWSCSIMCLVVTPASLLGHPDAGMCFGLEVVMMLWS